MPYRPKNKFEFYFAVIGESLYLILFAGGIIFLTGYALYQMILGNFRLFKEHPAVIVIIGIFFILAFSVLSTYNKKKN